MILKSIKTAAATAWLDAPRPHQLVEQALAGMKVAA